MGVLKKKELGGKGLGLVATVLPSPAMSPCTQPWAYPEVHDVIFSKGLSLVLSSLQLIWEGGRVEKEGTVEIETKQKQKTMAEGDSQAGEGCPSYCPGPYQHHHYKAFSWIPPAPGNSVSGANSLLSSCCFCAWLYRRAPLASLLHP